MIPLLIVAHGNLGDSLIQCVSFVLGNRPEQLESLDLSTCDAPDQILASARAQIARMDQGKGVLILTDVYGATPCNTICGLIEHAHVEAIAGVNLPMLLKALNYRDQDLAHLIRQAVQGGQNGVMYILPRDAHEDDYRDD
jgi:PTS system ascorbate-specific IIA component